MRRDAIGCARVPRHLAGLPRMRQGLEGWLADCDPARHGLPSGAIVLVRHLRTRWGDVIAAERTRRYQDLDTLLATARRPAAGGATDAAPVVWFADEAELLACIARDALAGVLRMRWWWRTLAPAAPDGAATAPARGFSAREPGVAHWLAAPRHVPRAVQRLGAVQATLWFARWAPAERAALVRALAQTYAVAASVADWVLESAAPQDAGVGRGLAAPTMDPVPPVASPVAPPAAPAPAPAARLQRLCADLATDPGAAGSPAYVSAVIAAGAAYAPPAQTVVPVGRDAAAILPSAGRAQAKAPPAAAGPSQSASMPPSASSPAAGPENASVAASPAAGVRPAPCLPAPPDVAPLLHSPPPASPSTEEALAEWIAPTAFRTRFGGLLFLLNAALQLSLYGDFSMPAARRLPCSPWRLLLLAGRAWCGRGFRADPLAAWLARRDGPDVPAIGGDWRIDPDWLAPFVQAHRASAPWRAAWEDGRLRLRHPAGFLVCDVAAAGAASEPLLAAELLRLGLGDPPGLVRVAVTHAGRSSRAARRRRHGCPHQIWAYLQARLALALDDGGAGDGRGRIAAMLAMPARVEASAERADVFFSLADLPLAVRLAGLDRDPGWIPAAGCDLRFHFR